MPDTRSPRRAGRLPRMRRPTSARPPATRAARAALGLPGRVRRVPSCPRLIPTAGSDHTRPPHPVPSSRRLRDPSTAAPVGTIDVYDMGGRPSRARSVIARGRSAIIAQPRGTSASSPPSRPSSGLRSAGSTVWQRDADASKRPASPRRALPQRPRRGQHHPRRPHLPACLTTPPRGPHRRGRRDSCRAWARSALYRHVPGAVRVIQPALLLEGEVEGEAKPEDEGEAAEEGPIVVWKSGYGTFPS